MAIVHQANIENPANLGEVVTALQAENMEQLERLIKSQIIEKTGLQGAYVRQQDKIAIGVEIHGLQQDLDLLEHLRRQSTQIPIVLI
jgi:hypothetical protein